MSTIDSIKNIIAERFGIEPSEIQSETTLNELGIDSLDSIDLLIELEKNHFIAIHDDEWEKISTIEDIEKLINLKTLNK